MWWGGFDGCGVIVGVRLGVGWLCWGLGYGRRVVDKIRVMF